MLDDEELVQIGKEKLNIISKIQRKKNSSREKGSTPKLRFDRMIQKDEKNYLMEHRNQKKRSGKNEEFSILIFSCFFSQLIQLKRFRIKYEGFV